MISSQFPISLGIIDENTADIRLNSNHAKTASIYMLNSNLPNMYSKTLKKINLYLLSSIIFTVCNTIILKFIDQFFRI